MHAPNKFMRRLLAAVLATAGAATTQAHADALSDDAAASSGKLLHKPARVMLGVEQIALPGNESMGMLGTTYLLQVTPGLYLGPAAYGAIAGQRGGFFTAGAELAWQQNLYSRLEVQAGLYAGGGGGGPSTVGGGLMLRPHLDLLWNFGPSRAGVSASSVRFPGGIINSRQIGLVFSAASDFAYTTPDQVGLWLDTPDRHGVGFDRVLATVGSYRPSTGAVSNSIGYAGMRMEHFFTRSLYWGIEAAGAASGNASGYAEFLGTLGAETPLWDDKLALGARLAIGMGGGSAALVSVGGGQLDKLGAYATAHLSHAAHLSVESGYATASSGKFRARYGSVNFTWDLDHPYASGSRAIIAGNEWAIGAEHYSAALHKDGSHSSLDAVTLKLNRYLNHAVYLTGQAHSAYRGSSGGYSAGLVGAGWRTQTFSGGVSAAAEMLIGAAGGGLVDTRGGAIVQAMVYLGMDIGQQAGVKLGAGRIKSLNGALSSNVLGVSADFLFGTGSR